MICSMIKPATAPSSASHLTMRHHAPKYRLACFALPVSISPNSQTQPSRTASEPMKMRA